jgi:hypothetical protein
MKCNNELGRVNVKKPRASTRDFLQRKSHYALKANGVQNHTAIPPRSFERVRSSERGILAFSRDHPLLLSISKGGTITSEKTSSTLTKNKDSEK